ncbi:Uncharacterised protein [Capnocytophaga canimorsus]|nr:Uncharacterised protein [Capnocytophaga canimorsus]
MMRFIYFDLFSHLYFCLETKVPKIQGCGYFAKNQFIPLKISELAPYGRFEQWIFSTFHSLIFLTLRLQCR